MLPNFCQLNFVHRQITGATKSLLLLLALINVAVFPVVTVNEVGTCTKHDTGQMLCDSVNIKIEARMIHVCVVIIINTIY